ncbi:hypothetical protein C5C90_09405 [Rathayibacter sp. AY1D4]|nr:hypothetical protein C5C35_06630 [Rathayibacter sp. AY1F8]PPH74860.1 hypothetical protein C5C90_09405 [Rathayibacter sp. AY1D4]
MVGLHGADPGVGRRVQAGSRVVVRLQQEEGDAAVPLDLDQARDSGGGEHVAADPAGGVDDVRVQAGDADPLERLRADEAQQRALDAGQPDLVLVAHRVRQAAVGLRLRDRPAQGRRLHRARRRTPTKTSGQGTSERTAAGPPNGAIRSRGGARSVVRACLGTMNEYLPWAVAAALLLALLITVVTGRRRRTAARAAAEEAAEEHQRTIAERDRSHEAALKALTRARDAERDLSRNELETAQEEVEQTRDALARTWSSEAVSHTLIREACASAGLSGVLATNVVFVPVDARTTRRFLAQIDHLLLTRHGALIIEAKYWQGVVFDGVRPGTVHPSYGVLLDEDALPEAFAVQIAPGTVSRWTVRTHVEQHVPARQVRIQAARLKEHLALNGLPTPWFETAVLYSHPDVRTYAPGWQGTGAARTRIVTGVDELTDALADLARRPNTTIGEDAWGELSGFLAGCGGHVEPVGPTRA